MADDRVACKLICISDRCTPGRTNYNRNAKSTIPQCNNFPDLPNDFDHFPDIEYQLFPGSQNSKYISSKETFQSHRVLSLVEIKKLIFCTSSYARPFRIALCPSNYTHITAHACLVLLLTHCITCISFEGPIPKCTCRLSLPRYVWLLVGPVSQFSAYKHNHISQSLSCLFQIQFKWLVYYSYCDD